MIVPPFQTEGDGHARFYCLAFVPVKYHSTFIPDIPAALGLYYCADRCFTRYSLSSHRADGSLLSYSRGEDDHDTLDFLLLAVAAGKPLCPLIHPSLWRLFPREQIPARFRSPGYQQSRSDLCRILFYFRSLTFADSLLETSPNPTMTLDESATPVSFGKFPGEDAEMERAVISVLKLGRRKTDPP